MGRSIQRLLLLLLLCSGQGGDARPAPAFPDEDRDGLDDRLEEALLRKFTPVFYLSAGECDGLPAEFQPGAPHPQVLARNGTIYGQVTPRTSPAAGAPWIEIHYFHLWGRDCGRAGHALDAEHVSVLAAGGSQPESAASWTAKFWYAAAHQDTVCDFGSAARAEHLGAQHGGASVWISRGKHASFLSPASCAWGCGGDVCKDSRPFRPARMINLGEPYALLNGSSWVASKKWQMLAKMRPDFTDDLVAFLDRPERSGVVALNSHLRPAQAVLLAGDSTADALTISGARTGSAVALAGTGAGQALQSAAGAVDDAEIATTGALQRSGSETGAALASTGRATGRTVAASARSTHTALRGAFRQTGRALGITRR